LLVNHGFDTALPSVVELDTGNLRQNLDHLGRSAHAEKRARVNQVRRFQVGHGRSEFR
jgi:hypothetical protein